MRSSQLQGRVNHPRLATALRPLAPTDGPEVSEEPPALRDEQSADAPPPLNLCRACGLDFTSLGGFDTHRVGKHDYSWSLEHLDGRRCLAPSELEERGFRQDARGRWRLPASGRAPWGKADAE